MNKLFATACLALAFGAVSAPAAEQPWVTRSNQNAQLLLAVEAKYSPESASSLGVEGYDEAISDFSRDDYEPMRADIPQRLNGVLISMEEGRANMYALDGLQDRGIFFVDAGDWCYEGQVVGEHCKDNDLVVNIQRAKKLTNIRAAGADRKLFAAPATKLSLEEALEYINDDELVEATPEVVRLRKYFLKEVDRKRKRDHDWTQAG